MKNVEQRAVIPIIIILWTITCWQIDDDEAEGYELSMVPQYSNKLWTTYTICSLTSPYG